MLKKETISDRALYTMPSVEKEIHQISFSWAYGWSTYLVSGGGWWGAPFTLWVGREASTAWPMALGCRYTWISWWPYNGHKGIQSMEEESGDPNNRAVKISMLPLHKTLWQAVKSTVSTSQFTEVPHLFLIVRGPTTVPGWDTWTRK